MTLTTDIYSTVNRKLYAPKGAKITLIADYGNVLIVEHKGNRFPVKKEYVS